MGRFVTNRDNVEAQIRQDHWIVAFSKRELTETDALDALIAAGGAIYTGQPEIIVGFLDELLDESIAGMEQAIEQSMATDFTNEIKTYAIPIIKNYLFGFSPGESNSTFGHFGVKAGLAKFIGHNEEWNAFANVGGFIGSLGQQDGGEWQQVGPGLVSYCPYVGLRFIQNIPNPPPSQPPGSNGLTEYAIVRFSNKTSHTQQIAFRWNGSDNQPKVVNLQPNGSWCWWTTSTTAFWQAFAQHGPNCQISTQGVILEFPVPAPTMTPQVAIIRTQANPSNPWSVPSAVNGKITINNILMDNNFHVSLQTIVLQP